MMMGFLPQGVLGPSQSVFIDRYSETDYDHIRPAYICNQFCHGDSWMDGNPVNQADSYDPSVPLHWFGVPYALPAGGYPADCTGGPAGEMRRVFPGPGVRVADTESGSGSCFIQFLGLSGIIFLDVIGALAAVCTLGITVIPGLPRGMDEGY